MPAPSRETLDALDWPVVRAALAALCQTVRAIESVDDDPFASTPQDASRRLREVAELWTLEDEGETPPLSSIHDIGETTFRTTKGEVLEPHELQAIGQTLGAISRLGAWVAARGEDAPELAQIAHGIAIDAFLVSHLEDSFTPSGDLSDTYYPELADLRGRIESARQHVRSTLNALLNDAGMADAFHDKYITDRGGRMVIPVRVQARKRLGIVHDTSQSGETAFVEPTAVVEQQNEIKRLDAELRRTIAKILAEMSREIGDAYTDIIDAVKAATLIDLASARARLGRRLGATLPVIGTHGQVHLSDAKHPVLSLRGVDVIPNTLSLSDAQSGVVLTGPNAGGKTISLKTIGLMSVMVRAGLPVPAADGARVDWFDPIIAVVGDQQDVTDDLSTFSSHLLGLKSALEGAQTGALVLLDEVAIGTDPKQGAALAQAVVESVVEAGARAVITTHYDEVKALAADHPKMALMGAVFADGRPTFRMEPGRFGRSHALAVARRMGLPVGVVDHARALLDAESRRMDDLLTEVETERERLREQAIVQAEAERKLAFEKTRLDGREAKLNARRDREDAEAREAFRVHLKTVERAIRDELKSLQGAPTIKSANALLDKVKGERAANRAEPQPLPPAQDHPLKVGDSVKLLQMDAKGTVLAIKGAMVEVDVRGKRMRLPRAAMHHVPTSSRPKPKPMKAAQSTRSPDGIRTDSNTLDLRGLRVHEALDEVETFLAHMKLSDHGCAYLLHGHGTGAIKTALRQWLPKSEFGRRWRVGGVDEGGDAFTVVVFA